MRVEWLPSAVDGFNAQLDYIEQSDPAAAVAVGDAVFEAVDRIASYPESAPRGRVEGTRELVLAGTPFIVVYQVDPARILILRVLHGAQRWPPED